MAESGSQVARISATTQAALQERERLANFVAGRIEAGDLRGALAACQRLNRICPDYAWGWYLASFLLRKAGNHAEALKAVGRALALEVTDRYLLERGKCLLEKGDVPEARAAVAALVGRDLADPMLHDDLGGVLHRLGDHRGALDQYSRAATLAPGKAQHHYNRAAILRYLGDAEGAEAAYDAAIALRPQDCEAYNGRAQLRTQTRERNHVAEIQAALETATSAATPISGRVELCHALAKELEDLGEWDASFARLKEGADLKRRHMRYDVETDLRIIERIREVFSRERLAAAPSGDLGAGAIFVFGMPRTGTTLVERVLSSHPEVCSAGELSTFSIELMRMTQALPGASQGSRLDFVERTAALDFPALGDAYLRCTAPHRDARPRFIEALFAHALKSSSVKSFRLPFNVI